MGKVVLGEPLAAEPCRPRSAEPIVGTFEQPVVVPVSGRHLPLQRGRDRELQRQGDGCEETRAPWRGHVALSGNGGSDGRPASARVTLRAATTRRNDGLLGAAGGGSPGPPRGRGRRRG